MADPVRRRGRLSSRGPTPLAPPLARFDDNNNQFLRSGANTGATPPRRLLPEALSTPAAPSPHRDGNMAAAAGTPRKFPTMLDTLLNTNAVVHRLEDHVHSVEDTVHAIDERLHRHSLQLKAVLAAKEMVHERLLEVEERGDTFVRGGPRLW